MRFTLFSICLLLLFSGSLYALNLNDLVLHFSFDEEGRADAEDISGTGNDGEFIGKVKEVEGQYGNGISIEEGPNGIVIQDSETMNNNGPMTIACWFNIELGGGAIVTKSGSYMVHLATWSQGPPWKREGQVEVEPLFDTGGGLGYMTSASVPVPLGEWHHIVAVYDGKEVLNYMDGKLEGSWKKEGLIVGGNVDVFIGGDSRGGIPPAGGSPMLLDEFMIFNRAVSAEEVKEIMDAAWLSVQPHHRLIGLWGSIRGGY